MTNATPESLLASLVHEEIVERHLRMPPRVNFLATANVLYRRSVLAGMDGFDERFLKGQDAELAWRVKAAGHVLAFDASARVAHHYHLRWRTYLRTQRQQGYWRAFLHTAHRGHSGGDSYSNLLDHLQPPVAMLVLLTAGFALVLAASGVRDGMIGAGRVGLLSAILAAALLFMQGPMVRRLVARTRSWKFAAFAPFGWVRSCYRGIGLSQGVLAMLWAGRSRQGPAARPETP